MAFTMTDDQARAFLAEGRRTGKVATVRPDGRPHVAPIWFVMDGADVVFMTGMGTVKGRSLSIDPRVAMTVDLEEPPYAFVVIEGAASLTSDLTEMLPWSIEIARRYMGDDQAEQFGARNAVEGELLVRVRPTRMIGQGDVAD